MNRKNSQHVRDLHPEIGRRIVELREEDNISQHVVADMCHVTPAAVSKWEKGGGLSLDNVVSVALAFHVNLDWLVLGKGRKR